MGRLLAVLGVLLTGFYLLFVWRVVGDRFYLLDEMALNEVGDFLAGVFGPLAILWLVLGFFQQGLELRQSTTALKMQADELKSSVVQQAAMVEVSRQQLDAALSAAQYERDLSEKNCEPHIDFQFDHIRYMPKIDCALFKLKNTGPRCTSLSVIYSESDEIQRDLGYFEVFSEKELQIEVDIRNLTKSEGRKVSLSYTKINGSRSHQIYEAQLFDPITGSIYVQLTRA